MTGDNELAEDIAQDAFVKMAYRLGGLRNPDASAAYLRQTVVNLSRSHFRRERVKRNYLQREASMHRMETAEERDIFVADALWNELQRLAYRQRGMVMNLDENLKRMLRERADGVAATPVVPDSTVRRVRVRKAMVAGGLTVAVAGVFIRSAIWNEAAPVPPADGSERTESATTIAEGSGEVRSRAVLGLCEFIFANCPDELPGDTCCPSRSLRTRGRGDLRVRVHRRRRSR